MRLKFVSNEKKLEMDGCGELDASVISISGLGIPDKKYNTVKYVDLPGQITLSESVLPREIAITGDICTKGAMPLSKYHIFFSDGGTMYIFNSSGRKKIDYKVSSFDTGEKKGDFVPFVLKIICDYPYFSDSVNSETGIYRRIDKISGDFSLPAVFTERLTEADIINSGQTASEPIIKVECTKQGVYSGGITLYNSKNNRSLTLGINLLLGEIITLDVKNREISSNLRANCFGVLSDSSVLSEFVIEKGINNISLTNKNNGETVKASIYFDNLYMEAV